MKHRLKAMERLLACQRSQAIVTPIAEAYVEEWEAAFAASRTLPDELVLIRQSTQAGVMPLNAGLVIRYLGNCRLTGTIPDPDRLVETIVHGWALSRGVYPKRCRCLARRTPSLAPATP